MSQFSYHVMIVESRKTQPFEEVKQQLKTAAYQQAAKDFAAKELPGIIESVELPK